MFSVHGAAVDVQYSTVQLEAGHEGGGALTSRVVRVNCSMCPVLKRVEARTCMLYIVYSTVVVRVGGGGTVVSVRSLL